MTHLNPESKVINPELIKAAAEMVHSQRIYKVENGNVLMNQFGYWSNASFSPLTSDSDAMKLERALKQYENGSWQFGCTFIEYHAETKKNGQHKMIISESDTLLLLLVVSAQTGIKMYGEAGK